MPQVIFQDTLKSLKTAYLLRAGISVAGGLLRLYRKGEIPGLSVLFNREIARFCFFLGSLTFFKKSLLHILRRYFANEDKRLAFISGFIAGAMSILFLRKGSRAVWAQYLFVRAMDTIFTSLQLRGIIKHRQWYYVLLMAISMLVCGYSYFYERECFAPALDQAFVKYQNFSMRDTEVAAALNQVKKR